MMSEQEDQAISNSFKKKKKIKILLPKAYVLLLRLDLNYCYVFFFMHPPEEHLIFMWSAMVSDGVLATMTIVGVLASWP